LPVSFCPPRKKPRQHFCQFFNSNITITISVITISININFINININNNNSISKVSFTPTKMANSTVESLTVSTSPHLEEAQNEISGFGKA
jgi:hypothetical protein